VDDHDDAARPQVVEPSSRASSSVLVPMGLATINGRRPAGSDRYGHRMTSEDVTRAVGLARETLAGAVDLDWHVPAGTLEWSCWETVEHVNDVLFGYAAQLGPSRLNETTYVPFGWAFRREGGPALTLYGDPEAGPAGLVEVLGTCGAMLVAMVDAAPPDRLVFHNYGASDASGFAAMGVVETLLHTHDVAAGLGLPWTPPADLCASALRRLFPAAPTDGDPWETLLEVTGRGKTELESWKWDGSPR
jgi:hypothetical protein